MSEHGEKVRAGILRSRHAKGQHIEPVQGCPECESAKEQQHEAALRAAQEVDREASIPFPEIGDPEAEVVVHVLEDGFTLLGKVWYRGEEIRLKRGSDTWQLSVGPDGRSVLEMSVAEQFQRYGRQMFGQGPWPYVPFSEVLAELEGGEGAGEAKAILSDDPEALRKIEKARQRKALERPQFLR